MEDGGCENYFSLDSLLVRDAKEDTRRKSFARPNPQMFRRVVTLWW